MNIIDKMFNDPMWDELNNMNRWNGVNRIKEETVAHHSFIVTMMVRLISEEIFKADELSKLKATTYAIFHDFDEVFTGDINHNVKHNSHNGNDIRKSLNDYIGYRAKEKFNHLYPVSEALIFKILNNDIPIHIKNLVKVCDWLSMIFYLKKERSLGNSSVNSKYIYCVQSLFTSIEIAIESLDFETNVISDISILNEIKKKNFA